ncbi:hypothetical protein VTL71DRAFT_9778 [Oculimacula yallundae]|uniref:Uncharacterized protein n=1 Tax=Oculimacula yallundae TaxID=86028 RepID=A0ABR4BUM1_9HELO
MRSSTVPPSSWWRTVAGAKQPLSQVQVAVAESMKPAGRARERVGERGDIVNNVNTAMIIITVILPVAAVPDVIVMQISASGKSYVKKAPLSIPNDKVREVKDSAVDAAADSDQCRVGSTPHPSTHDLA